MIEYGAAFTIGLLGSVHCIGMCGPIALALPLERSSSFAIVAGSTIYNLGRLTTYACLGLFFGTLGKSFAIAGLQQSLSILVGIIIIVLAIWPTLKARVMFFPAFNLWLGKLKGVLAQRLGKKTYMNLFIIGVLNGLLPCGLVYMGVVGASAMANSVKGVFFMLLFGLGTFPALLIINVFGAQLKTKFAVSFRKYTPVFIVVIGTLFILRGMNLGIPYISPKMSNNVEVKSCH